MTNKEKKEYLYRYKNLEKSIERLMQEAERWRAKAEKMTQTISDMPHGGDGEDQRQLAICNMMDCADNAAGKLCEQMDIKKEIEKTIESVNDDKLELLLMYRYIDGQRWEDITQLLKCSWRQVHYLHSQALKEIKIN